MPVRKSNRLTLNRILLPLSFDKPVYSNMTSSTISVFALDKFAKTFAKKRTNGAQVPNPQVLNQALDFSC